MKKHRHKERNVNLAPVRIGKVTVHAGDSLAEVNCGAKVKRFMHRNLRRRASRSDIVFPLRQKTAREIMAEYKIPIRK